MNYRYMDAISCPGVRLFRQLSETMGTIMCSLNLRKEVMV